MKLIQNLHSSVYLKRNLAVKNQSLNWTSDPSLRKMFFNQAQCPLLSDKESVQSSNGIDSGSPWTHGDYEIVPILWGDLLPDLKCLVETIVMYYHHKSSLPFGQLVSKWELCHT